LFIGVIGVEFFQFAVEMGAHAPRVRFATPRRECPGKDVRRGGASNRSRRRLRSPFVLHEIEIRRPAGLTGVDLVFVFTSAFSLRPSAFSPKISLKKVATVISAQCLLG
jgi:hypothetical protein